MLIDLNDPTPLTPMEALIMLGNALVYLFYEDENWDSLTSATLNIRAAMYRLRADLVKKKVFGGMVGRDVVLF